MDGKVDGWMDGKAGLRIAYSKCKQAIMAVAKNLYLKQKKKKNTSPNWLKNKNEAPNSSLTTSH